MDEREAAMGELETTCNNCGIKLCIKELLNDYFIYHEDRKEIILNTQSKGKHIRLLIDFILYEPKNNKV